MAFTTGNDVNILQGSDTAVVGAGAGDDKYILSPSNLTAGQNVQISDADGANVLQLIGGLEITSSMVANDAVQLTLSNGATVTVLGASSFSYEIGGNPLTGDAGTIYNYSDFATTALGAAAVPAVGDAPVSGADDVTVNADGTTSGAVTFELTASAASVVEGDTATYTVTASEPVAEDTQVTFQLVANGTQSSNTTLAETADFAVGSFTPVTVTIPAGSTMASFDVATVLDQISEQSENYSVEATVNGEILSVMGRIDESTAPQPQTIILTTDQDEVTPTSTNPGQQTSAGDDAIFAGSVAGSGAHTLGATDNIDGGDGIDTMTIVEDRSAPTPPATNTLFPTMTNVENVDVQALTTAAVDFTNTTGIETINNAQSVAGTTITNLVDDAEFVFTNTTQNTTVGYFNNNNADTTADVTFDQSNGASLAFSNTNGVGNSIDTLNVALNNQASYNITNATFDGLNQTNNLTTINLSGDTAATTVAQLVAVGNENAADTAAGLTENVTTFNAAMLQGTLGINLLGNNNGIDFDGAMGATSLVIGNGANDITMQDANDLVVLSSTGFDANDMMDGAGGTDRLEIHFNDTDAATDLDGSGANTDVLDAINNTVNTEELVIDVWSQATDGTAGVENVNLDRALITSDFSTFIFDDTRTDGAAPANNVQDSDISGTVNVTNATAADDYQIAVDQVTAMSFTAAAGETILNVTHNDADLVNDMIGSFDSDVFTTTNLTVNAADEDYMLAASQVDAGATLNLLGAADQMTANFGAEGDGATLDASTLVTTTDRDALIGADFNVFTVTNGNDTTVKGTDQDDDITGNIGDDELHGNAGDDVIVAGAGDDTVMGGAGDDVIVAGTGATILEGVDTLSGGAGDDTFEFTFSTNAATEGLTSADIIDGGDDNDTVEITTGAAQFNDQIFNGFTSVEELTLAGGANTITVNAIANANGLEVINAEGTGIDTINVGEGFNNDLEINLGSGDDVIVGDNAPGAITVNVDATNLDGADALALGKGSMDTLNIISDGTTADTAGVSNVEMINIIDEAPLVNNGPTTLFVDDNIFDTNNAGQQDALTVDGSTVTDDLVIDATAIGSDANNVLTTLTGAGADEIYGSGNVDIINGGAGNDTIFGGNGADMLTGGTGADSFTFTSVANSSSTNTDTIMDFVGGTAVAGTNSGDRIVVEDAILGGLTLNFAGNESDFGSAQGAATAGDAFIDYVFQTDTNTLWVDINNDGTLNADDLQITLDGVTALTGDNTGNTATNDVIAGTVQTSVAGYSIVDTAANVAALPPAYIAGANSVTVTDDATFAQAVTIDSASTGPTTFAGVRDTLANAKTAITNSTAGVVNAAIAKAGSVDVTEVSGDISALAIDANVVNYELASGTNAQMSDEQFAKVVNNAAGTNTVTIGNTTSATAIDNVVAISTVENYIIGQDSDTSFSISAITGAQTVDASNAQADDVTTVSVENTLSNTSTITGAGGNDVLNLGANANIAFAKIDSANNMANFATVNLANNGNATMNATQHNNITTLNAIGTNTLTLTTTAVSTADADIETYALLDDNNVITTFSNTDVNITTTNTGVFQTTQIDTNGAAYTGTATLAGTDDSIIFDTGVDYSAGTYTSIESAMITSSASITLQVADYNNFGTNFNASGTETVTFSDAGTISADAAVEIYIATAGNALTVNVGEAASGAYVITGNTGNDVVNLNAGWDATTDVIAGGIGVDTVNINQDFGGAANLATGITQVEQINVTAAQAGALTIDDTITTGDLTVDASTLTSGLTITNTVNGSNGDLTINFGSGVDTLDKIDGTGSNDIIVNFGSGNDTLSDIAVTTTGTITLGFGTSAAGNIDNNTIAATTADLATGDTITIDGVAIGALAATLVASGSAGVANTLVVTNDATDSLLSFDANGNGVLDAGSDFQITILGQALSTTDFNIVAGDAVIA